MHTVIIGAGAVGGYTGGHLARAGFVGDDYDVGAIHQFAGKAGFVVKAFYATVMTRRGRVGDEAYLMPELGQLDREIAERRFRTAHSLPVGRLDHVIDVGAVDEGDLHGKP